MKRTISAILAAAMLLVSANFVYAAEGETSSKFYMPEMSGYPAIIRGVQSGKGYRSNEGGPVVYGEQDKTRKDIDGKYLDYQAYPKPAKLENDIFDSALPYMCYGGGSTVGAGENLTSFAFTSHETLEEGDAVYISFYYRAASKFKGVGQKADTEFKGEAVEVQLYPFSTGYPKAFYLTESGSNKQSITAEPDDTWHRVEGTLYLDANAMKKVSNNTVSLLAAIPDLSKAAYIEFAGFRFGVLKPNGEATGNDHSYTKIGWHMQNSEVSKIAVNGTELDLSGDKTEFNVSGTAAAPSVAVTSDHGVQYSLEKLAYNRYKVTTYAAGYDFTKADTDTVTFRSRYNKANGAFNGVQPYTTTAINGDLKGKTYYINIDIADNFKMYPLDSVVHGCDNALRDTWVEYNTNGGYYINKEKWTDEGDFTEGYSLNMYKPEGASTPATGYNMLQAMFDLGDDTVNTGDILYFSFYVKGDAEHFYIPQVIGSNADDSTFRSGLLLPHRKDRSSEYPNEIGFSTDCYKVRHANHWYKFSGYYRITENCNVKDLLKLSIYMNKWNLWKKGTIKFTDFRCGVLKGFTPSTTDSNMDNEIKTAITSALLDDINVYQLTVDDKGFDTAGNTAVAAVSSVPLPKIGIEAYHGAVPVTVTKKTAGNSLPAEYEIKVYSDGYDRAVSESTATSFLNRPAVYNESTKTWSTPNKDITKKNSDFVKTFTLTVSKAADYSDYDFAIDGKRVTDFADLSGKTASFGIRLDKFAGETGYEMMLAAYDADGRLINVASVPYTYGANDTDSYSKAYIGMGDENAASFKVLIWNTKTNMKALCRDYGIDAGGIRQ